MSLLHLPKALLIYKKWEYPKNPARKEHEEALKQITHILKKHKIPFQKILRERLKGLGDASLIITLGGDGTFLHASHFAKTHHLLLGVNSAPSVSYGAFCAANAKNFESLIVKILTQKAAISYLNRLQIKINKKPIAHFALNDVLFANPNPAGTSRYIIQLSKMIETQKSSGVWISTAAGSTGALHSAGGQVLSKTSKNIQFVVREPFLGGRKKIKLNKKILKPNQALVFISQMTHGMLFIDGAHLQYPIHFEDKIEIKNSQESIRAVLC